MPNIKTTETAIANIPDGMTNNLVTQIIDAIRDVKGSAITTVNLEEIDTAPASCFVICQGKSSTQVNAIYENIEEKVREHCGVKPYGIDGTRNGQWIVMDYGPVLAHIFLPETRQLYNLEDLWSDARITEIPDLD